MSCLLRRAAQRGLAAHQVRARPRDRGAQPTPFLGIILLDITNFGRINDVVDELGTRTRTHLLHVNTIAQRWAPRLALDAAEHETIHPLARAISVIDAYSAMRLDRPYHRAIAAEDALLELERCAGTQFDAEYVASFTG